VGEAPVREVHQKDLISVIIPVLNEERDLARCLASVTSQTFPFEIIIVDGGSTDESVKIAGKYPVKVIESETGRWYQMNKGAEIASGAILLFLHADSRLPPNAFEKIRNAVAGGLGGGAFTLTYEPSSFWLAFGVFWGNALIWATREFQGDRAIFCHRKVFDKLHGYKNLELMEDLDFSVRMKKAGFRTIQIPGPVVTSSRRFEGVNGLTVFYWTVRLLIEYHLGRDPDKSAADFYKAMDR